MGNVIQVMTFCFYSYVRSHALIEYKQLLDVASCLVFGWSPHQCIFFVSSYRHRYNQAAHVIQNKTWESDKNTIKHHTQESQEVSPFQTGGYNEQTRKHDKHETNNKKDPQKKHSIGAVSKNSFYWRA